MTIRPIRLFGDPVLTSECSTIHNFDEKIHALADDLMDSVALPGRAGVAANQIGIGLRAFSYNVDGAIGYVLNPELVEVSGDPALMGEGCLSVPGLWFEVMRYPFAKVVGRDTKGNEIVLEGSGLMAQALQHECDHLDGKLYIDRLDRNQRKEALRQIRESDWF